MEIKVLPIYWRLSTGGWAHCRSEAMQSIRSRTSIQPPEIDDENVLSILMPRTASGHRLAVVEAGRSSRFLFADARFRLPV